MASINFQPIQGIPSSSVYPAEESAILQSYARDDKLPPLGNQQHLKILSLLTNPYPIKNLENTHLITITLGLFLTKLINKYRQNIIGVYAVGSGTSWALGKEYFERYSNSKLSSKLAKELETLPQDIDFRILFKKEDEGLIRIMKHEFIDYFCDDLKASREIEFQKPFTKQKYVDKSDNGNHFSLIGIHGGQVKLEFIFTSGLQTDYLMQAFDLYIPIDSYLEYRLMKTPITDMNEDQIAQLIESIPSIHPFGINDGGHLALRDRMLKFMNVPMITNENGWNKILKYNMRGFQFDTSLIAKLITEFNTYCKKSPPSATLYQLIKQCALDQNPNDPVLLVHLVLSATFLFRNRLIDVEVIPGSELQHLWTLLREDTFKIADSLPVILKDMIHLITDEQGPGLQMTCLIIQLATLFSGQSTKVNSTGQVACQDQWMLEFAYNDFSSYLQMQIVPEICWDQFCEVIATNKHVKVLTKLFNHFFSNQVSVNRPQVLIVEFWLKSLKSDRQPIRLYALSFLAIVSKNPSLSNRIVEEVVDLFPRLYVSSSSSKAKTNLTRKVAIILGKRFLPALSRVERSCNEKINQKRIDYTWYSEISVIDPSYFFRYLEEIPPRLRADFVCHFLQKGTLPTLEHRLITLHRILTVDPSQLTNCLEFLMDSVFTGNLSKEVLILIGSLLLLITRLHDEKIILHKKYQFTFSTLTKILLEAGHFETVEEILTATYRPDCIFLQKEDQMMLWNMLFESLENQEGHDSRQILKRTVDKGIFSLEVTEEATPLCLLTLKINDCLERDLYQHAFSNFYRLLSQPIQKNQRPRVLQIFNVLWEKSNYYIGVDQESAFLNMLIIIENQSLRNHFPKLVKKRSDEVLQRASEFYLILKSATIKKLIMATFTKESLESNSLDQIASKVNQILLLLDHIGQQHSNFDKALLDRLLILFEIKDMDPLPLLMILWKIHLNYLQPLDEKQSQTCLAFMNRVLADFDGVVFTKGEELFGKLLNQFEKGNQIKQTCAIIIFLFPKLCAGYGVQSYGRYVNFLIKNHQKTEISQRTKIFDILKDYLILLEKNGNYSEVLENLNGWKNLPFIRDFLPRVLTHSLIDSCPEKCLDFLFSIRQLGAIKSVLKQSQIIDRVTENIVKADFIKGAQLEALLYFINFQDHVDIKLLMHLYLSIKAEFTISVKKVQVAKYFQSFFKIFQKLNDKGYFNAFPNERFFLWNESMSLPGFLDVNMCLNYIKNPLELINIFAHIEQKQPLIDFFKSILERLVKHLDQIPFLQMIDNAHLILFEALKKNGWSGNLWMLCDKYVELLVPTQNESAFIHMIITLTYILEKSEPEDIPRSLLFSSLHKIMKTFEKFHESKNVNSTLINNLFDISASIIAPWDETIRFLNELMDSPLFIVRVNALGILKKTVWHPYIEINEEFRNLFSSCINKMINVAKGVEIAYLSEEFLDTFTDSPIGRPCVNRLFALIVDKYLTLYEVDKDQKVKTAILDDCIKHIESRYIEGGYGAIVQCNFERLQSHIVSHFLTYKVLDKFVKNTLRAASLMPDTPYMFIQKVLNKINVINIEHPLLGTKQSPKCEKTLLPLLNICMIASFKLLVETLSQTHMKIRMGTPLKDTDLDSLNALLGTFVFNFHLTPSQEFAFYKQLVNKLLKKIEETFQDSTYFEKVSHFFLVVKWYPYFDMIQMNCPPFFSTYDYNALTLYPINDISKMLVAVSTISSFVNISFLLNILISIEPNIFFHDSFKVGYMINHVSGFLKRNPVPEQNASLLDLACRITTKFSNYYHEAHLPPEGILFIHKLLLMINLNRLLHTHPNDENKIEYLSLTCALMAQARNAGVYKGFNIQYLIDVKGILRNCKINLHKPAVFSSFLFFGVLLMSDIEFQNTLPFDKCHHLPELLCSWILTGMTPEYGKKHYPFILNELNNPIIVQIFFANMPLYYMLLSCMEKNDLTPVTDLIKESSSQIKIRTIGDLHYYDCK